MRKVKHNFKAQPKTSHEEQNIDGVLFEILLETAQIYYYIPKIYLERLQSLNFAVYERKQLHSQLYMCDGV
jgi:hypothetical protein